MSEATLTSATQAPPPALAPPLLQPAAAPAVNVEEEVYLIGRPPLSSFLRFMQEDTIEGATLGEGALTDEWRVANEYGHEVERTEAAWADKPRIAPLPPHLMPLRAEFLKDPLVQNGFNTVPTEIGPHPSQMAADHAPMRNR